MGGRVTGGVGCEEVWGDLEGGAAVADGAVDLVVDAPEVVFHGLGVRLQHGRSLHACPPRVTQHHTP
eukprot:3937678-Rhodomonas_salina.2